MPWSPVPKFPDVIKEINRMGYDKQCQINTLRKAVVYITGIVRDSTIRNIIEKMELLDYIKSTPNGMFDVCKMDADGRPVTE